MLGVKQLPHQYVTDKVWVWVDGQQVCAELLTQESVIALVCLIVHPKLHLPGSSLINIDDLLGDIIPRDGGGGTQHPPVKLSARVPVKVQFYGGEEATDPVHSGVVDGGHLLTRFLLGLHEEIGDLGLSVLLNNGVNMSGALRLI